MAKKEEPQSEIDLLIDSLKRDGTSIRQIGGGCCGGGCGRMPVNQLVDILDDVEKQQTNNKKRT